MDFTYQYEHKHTDKYSKPKNVNENRWKLW